MTYSPGMAFCGDSDGVDKNDNKTGKWSINGDPKVHATNSLTHTTNDLTMNIASLTAKITTTEGNVCRFCGRHGHSRRSSKQCMQHFVIVTMRNERQLQKKTGKDPSATFTSTGSTGTKTIDANSNVVMRIPEKKGNRVTSEVAQLCKPITTETHVRMEFGKSRNWVSANTSTAVSADARKMENLLSEVEVLDTLGADDNK